MFAKKMIFLPFSYIFCSKSPCNKQVVLRSTRTPYRRLNFCLQLSIGILDPWLKSLGGYFFRSLNVFQIHATCTCASDRSGEFIFSISDHLARFLITPSADSKTAKIQNIKVRDTNYCCHEELETDILNVDWKEVFGSDRADPNRSFQCSNDILNEILDKHRPWNVTCLWHREKYVSTLLIGTKHFRFQRGYKE